MWVAHVEREQSAMFQTQGNEPVMLDESPLDDTLRQKAMRVYLDEETINIHTAGITFNQRRLKVLYTIFFLALFIGFSIALYMVTLKIQAPAEYWEKFILLIEASAFLSFTITCAGKYAHIHILHITQSLKDAQWPRITFFSIFTLVVSAGLSVAAFHKHILLQFAAFILILLLFLWFLEIYIVWLARFTFLADKLSSEAAICFMSQYPKGLSIVVPVYNEVASVGKLLRRVDSVMKYINYPYEVIIVDDHSTDGTVDIAKQVIDAYHFPAQVITKHGKKGKSFSLLEGYALAQYEVLGMIDGDLEYLPESFPKMLQKLAVSHIVVGDRRGRYKRSSMRTYLSSLFNEIICNWGFQLPYDVQSGIKVFYHDVYDGIATHPGKWSFDLDFLAQAEAQNYRISQCNVGFDPRKSGMSKVIPYKVAIELLIHAVQLKFRITWRSVQHIISHIFHNKKP